MVKSKAWQELEAHYGEMAESQMRDMFGADANRFATFSLTQDDFLFDFSKNRISEQTISLLIALARERGLEEARRAMFAGEKINTTEDRSVLHVALRAGSSDSYVCDGEDVMGDVREVLEQMRALTVSLRGGIWKGHTGEAITDIVNVGIGGSDLGPAMATQALKAFHKEGLSFHFVSNIDPQDLTGVLKQLNPATTLFIVASKTFTTDETLTNALTARTWLQATLGEDAVERHFVAVSTNREAVKEFGIDPWNMFPFWDWVGGRFSLWSSVGLSLAIAIGMEAFEDFHRGARDMDQHFRVTDLEHNMPVILGLIGIWNTNFLGARSHAVLPYDQHLARFPAYLQQLEMESNGKSVDKQGNPVSIATCPALFGEPGTNGQHAFYQLLHQGPNPVPADFIAFAQGSIEIGAHHDKLLANCLAQSEALMLGQDHPDPHRRFSGNRPSNTLIFKRLTPHTLGKLIALYEHKVFVQGVIWGINSFDQFGVELGKKLAGTIYAERSGKAAPTPHDSSTNGLMAHLKYLEEA